MRTRSEKKRKAIIEAAKSVFFEKGYEAASMAEVSARAGGSKQTLYSYFGSKAELFASVMKEEGANHVFAVFDQFANNADLGEALTTFGKALLSFINTDNVVAFKRIVVAEGARSELGMVFYELGPKRGWTQMASYFENAMSAGRMRRSDPWRAAMQFQALCECGPYQRRLEGSLPILTPQEIADNVDSAVDVFMRAYGPASA